MNKIFLSLVLAFLLVSLAYAQGPGLTSPTKPGVKYDDNGIVVPSSPTEKFSKPFSAIRKWATGLGSKFVPGSQVPVQPELLEGVPSFVQERQEAYMERIQEHREVMIQKRAEVQERIEYQRTELKTRLQTIQNERKQRIAERIDEQLTALNKRMTNHYLHLLERIEAVLINIETRTDKAAQRGLEIGEVREAINTAHKVIEANSVAVTEQAGRIYAIEVGNEDTLKIDVGAARQALHNDLRSVRDTVRAAHDATRSAAVTLAQIPRVDDEMGTE